MSAQQDETSDDPDHACLFGGKDSKALRGTLRTDRKVNKIRFLFATRPRLLSNSSDTICRNKKPQLFCYQWLENFCRHENRPFYKGLPVKSRVRA
jgi:hypothetical protein